MTRPLQGHRAALAEGRQLEELARMLEQEGATALRYPLVSILDAPDPAPLISWLQLLIADRFHYAILMTGEGLRRLRGVAQRANLEKGMIAALGKTRIVTRGPKPVKALKEIGLAPSLVADSPTTAGVIATLQREPLRQRAVGVQLYPEQNPSLVQFLESSGAEVFPVLPYVYAPATDADRVAELIGHMAEGKIDVAIFTSSPQVDRLYEVASARNLEQALALGLSRVQVAAVGPVVAESLRRRGAKVAICPEQGFVMKNLVQHIKRALGGEA